MSSDTTTTTTTNADGTSSSVTTSRISEWEGTVSGWWSSFHAHLTQWLDHAHTIAKGSMFASIAYGVYSVVKHHLL